MDNLIDDPNSASGKRINYVKNLTYSEYNEALLKRDAEIERLEAAATEWEKVCDSYAKENGQFHAEIERLTRQRDEFKEQAERQMTIALGLRAALETIAKYHADDVDSACAAIARRAISNEQ